MANFNRAARRSRPDKNTVREVRLPAHLDELNVFHMVDTMVMQLEKGVIDVADIDEKEVAVYKGPDGKVIELAPALDGWIFTWHEIKTALERPILLNNLKKILSNLHNSEMIEPLTLAWARHEINSCRQLFRTADRNALMSIAKTAQIKIMEGTNVNS